MYNSVGHPPGGCLQKNFLQQNRVKSLHKNN